MLNLSVDECRTIDAELEKTLAWAQVRTAEAEQLAFDATRLLSCTEDRFKDLKNQHFFKRCWGRFSGKTGEVERTNTNDLIQMQKMSFRYLNLLQERDLLLGHAMLSLKNNLLSLAIKETETRNMIQLLAEKTLDRFERLESRVDQLEMSVNIQGWLLTLEERSYTQKFPSSYLRMLRLVNDFYGYKKDNWNYQDLLFMRSALRQCDLIPEQHINMDGLIDGLIDEIYETGFDQYQNLLVQWKPASVENYTEFILDNISCQVGATLHGLVYQYVDRMEIVEELKEELAISEKDALKRLLKKAITKLNVDLEVQIPLAEIVFEIFGYMRLAEKLMGEVEQEKEVKSSPEVKIFKEPESSSMPEEKPPLTRDIKSARINCELLTDLPFNPNDVLDFAYGDKFWLLYTKTGGGKIKFYSSQDGREWKQAEIQINDVDCWHRPNLIKYENDTWLLITDHSFHYSEDGMTWHSREANNINNSVGELKNVFFYNNYWVFVTEKEKCFSYTENVLFWKKQKTRSFYVQVFYRSTSLKGTCEMWHELSNFSKNRAYISELCNCNSGKVILASFGYAEWYIDNDDPYIHCGVYCFFPEQGWIKTICATNKMKGLRNNLFLEFNNKFMMIPNNGNHIVLSTNGVEWEPIEIKNFSIDYGLIVKNVVFLFDKWRKDKLFVSADANSFFEIPWNSKGDLDRIKTDGKIILSMIQMSSEKYLQIGRLDY